MSHIHNTHHTLEAFTARMGDPESLQDGRFFVVGEHAYHLLTVVSDTEPERPMYFVEVHHVPDCPNLSFATTQGAHYGDPASFVCAHEFETSEQMNAWAAGQFAQLIGKF